MTDPKKWTKGSTFIATLRKLRELSLRARRLELAAKIARTKAMLAAMTPSNSEDPRG